MNNENVQKRICKNEYNCPSDMCLSDIITSSRISLIIFSIDFFLIRRLKVTPIFLSFDEIRKNYIPLSDFDRIKKSKLFFEATFLSNSSDIILLNSTNFSKQEFMENVY